MDASNESIWYLFFFVVLAIGCIWFDVKVWRRWRIRQPMLLPDTGPPPDFSTPENIRIYLTYVLETGGTARCQEALRTVQVARGWTDEQMQTVFFDVMKAFKK